MTPTAFILEGKLYDWHTGNALPPDWAGVAGVWSDADAKYIPLRTWHDGTERHWMQHTRKEVTR